MRAYERLLEYVTYATQSAPDRECHPSTPGQFDLARRLVERLLTDARSEGYQAMLLDTFPFLSGAIRLYRTLGFYEIPSYNNSHLDSLIYMRKDLCHACSFCG